MQTFKGKTFYETLAEQIGVALNESFVVYNNSKSFPCYITEKGLYHSVTNDRLSGNVVLQIIDGDLLVKTVGWRPKFTETVLKPYIDPHGNIDIMLSRWEDRYSDWLFLSEGLVFPYTDNKETVEEYINKAKTKLHEIKRNYAVM